MRRKAANAVKTVADLAAAEEAFISGAKAEIDEKPPAPVEPAMVPEKLISAHKAAKVKPTPTKVSKADDKPLDPYSLVRRTAWPITFSPKSPILTEGRSDIDKPFIMRQKEDLWNSIDSHCRSLGVPKSEWAREAMLRQLYEEQQYFLEEEAKKAR
jgi:hypothetical protein